MSREHGFGFSAFLVYVQCSENRVFLQASAKDVVAKFLPKATTSVTCVVYWDARDEHGVGTDVSVRHSARWLLMSQVPFLRSPRQENVQHFDVQVGESVLTPVVSSRSPRLTNRLLNSGAT